MSTACGNAGTAAMAGATALSAVGYGLATAATGIGAPVAAAYFMFVGLQTLTSAIGMKKKIKEKKQEITDKCNQINHTAKQQKFINDLIIRLQKSEEIEEDTKEQLNGMIIEAKDMKDKLKSKQNAYMIRLAIFIIINIVAVSALLIMKDF